MIRVFVVDDHELVRRGVVDLIDAAPDMTVVGEADGAASALARILAVRPEVAVLDMRLPDGNGVDLCRDVRSALPGTACLILTAFDDDRASAAAVLAGAAGYVLKDIRANGLLEGIRRVAEGKRIIDPAATEHVRDAGARPAVELTLRERQVLDLIADGLTNRQIGERLELVEKTVKNYVSGVLRKLGVESRTQAAVLRVQQCADETMG